MAVDSVITPIYQGQTAVILGTGPGLTDKTTKIVIKGYNFKKWKLFGVNNTWQIFHLDVFLACNPNYWDHYWSKGLCNTASEKWTWDKETAKKYNVNYIEGKWEPGLSTDPNYIHYHHGSGPQIVNIALHYGITRMLLAGWDMHYGEKRHYFGEYPEPLLHFPKTGPQGAMVGLIKEMETIRPEDYGIEIINCTPDSAMKCFPFGRLEDYL